MAISSRRAFNSRRISCIASTSSRLGSFEVTSTAAVAFAIVESLVSVISRSRWVLRLWLLRIGQGAALVQHRLVGCDGHRQVAGYWSAPDAARGEHNSLCNSSRRVPMTSDGRAPRFPLRKALIVDWLHGMRSANSCSVSPVSRISTVIFLVSMAVIITYVFSERNTFVMPILITIVI